MATNEREFIAANALPVTEAEEVNVLVVDPETGELAQKAGANLGGGSSVDGIISCTTSPVSANNVDAFTLTDFDYEAIKAKIISGSVPNILVKHDFTYGDTYSAVGKVIDVDYAKNYDCIDIGYVMTTGESGYVNYIRLRIASSGVFGATTRLLA